MVRGVWAVLHDDGILQSCCIKNSIFWRIWGWYLAARSTLVAHSYASEWWWNLYHLVHRYYSDPKVNQIKSCNLIGWKMAQVLTVTQNCRCATFHVHKKQLCVKVWSLLYYTEWFKVNWRDSVVAVETSILNQIIKFVNISIKTIYGLHHFDC